MLPRVLACALVVLASVPIGGGSASAACGLTGTPTTTLYLPNITKTLGGPTGWVTPFIVQNVGSAATTLEVSFYDFATGALVTCRTVTGLAPQTSFADIPNSDADLPHGSAFSVVVRSFGSEVVAVVNEHQGEGSRAEALSYAGLSSGATRVGLPWVARADGGWLTTFIVQNLGTSAATVTAAFSNDDGTRTAVLSRTVQPGRSWAVNPANEPALLDGTSYAVVLTSDQPIGVVANAHNDAAGTAQPMAFSYNGAPLQTGEMNVPWVARNADGGRTTTVVVENLGTSAATPQLTFRRIGGSEQATVQLASVLPGRSVRYAMPISAATCPVGGTTSCPREGEHALTVAGGSFAVLAYALGGGAVMGGTGLGTGSSRVYLPNVTRTLGGASGWTTPIAIQSAGATTAMLRWYRFADGQLAVTQYVAGLSAGSSVKVDPRDVATLADGTQYGVVVDGNGPLRAVVLEISSTGGDGTMAYEGFAATGSLTPVPTITSVSLAPPSTTATIGGSTQLTATVKDQSGNAIVGVPLTWSVSPAGVGTISAAGLFTSTGQAGTATVTAVFGSLSATATVTVAASTVTVGGFTFSVRTTATTDVYVESSISTSDAQTIATTADLDVTAVQTTYARAFTSRPPVYVFASTGAYTTGLQSVLGLPPASAAISGAESYGYYRSTTASGALTTKLALNWEKVRTQQPATTLRHELTHAMIMQIVNGSADVPAWINEGSARLEEFTIAGTAYDRLRNRYSAASMVAVRNSFSVDDLTSQETWNARTGLAGVAQYYEASQIVQLLRDDIGTAGVTRILELMGQGQPFETAFGSVAGLTRAAFAAAVPTRLQAISPFYPGVATAPDEPGNAAGLSYIAYGFAPATNVRIDIVGQGQGYQNTVKNWTTDAYGTVFLYFGPGWPADTYSITVTGLTPPSSTQPNTTVTVSVSSAKAATFTGLSLTW